MKKIGILFATIIMLVLFAVSASALEPTGQCGDNAYWSFDSATGELVIEGNGKIDNGVFRRENDIISVIIESGITSFDYNVFRECESLSEVYLDKSLRCIGSYAFYDCSNLNTVYYNGTEKDFYRLIEASPRSYLYTVNGMSNPKIVFALSGETSVFKEKDKFAYGSYPQTKLTDETLIETLKNLGVEFVGDFADVEYLGEKYRAVSADGLVSWYKYEPIIWRVINPDTGMVLSDSILDKKSYNDTDEWLDSFCNVAFNKDQQTEIATVARAHESFSDQPSYGYSGYSEETIFLATICELDITYSYPFAGFGTQATDYAELSNKNWWLRTSVSGTSSKAYYMSNDTFVKSQPADESSVFGLRPAMCLELENVTCEHSYSEIIAAPTCEDKGYTTYTCVCGDSYVDDYVDKLDHKYISKITIPATHTSEGVRTFTCECDASYTEVIPKLTEHTYTSSVTTEPTHLKEGVRTYICECNDTYTEVIPKLTEHTYISTVTPPTCIEQGYTTYTCECGDSYIDDYVKENGHKYESEITTETTHLKEGVETFTCHCGDTYTKSVPKLTTHTYKEVVTEPTHLTEGIKTFTCECGDTYTETIEKLKEHTYEKEITAPTCTKQGYTTFTCACGDSYVGDYVNEKGHSYSSNTVQPTCTKSGTVTTFCTSCGDTYTETIEPTGHNFDGSKCTNCDYDKASDCSCNCHKGGIAGFFFKIILFFQKIFRTNKTCSCGVNHY